MNRYVEKADFVAIVAPGCLHADRRDPETKLRTKTCYRTYRKRGWCVLEMFAAYLSREKTHPILLITSANGSPEWVSTLESQKLAVGTCEFTCCQRNHKFGDKIVPCDRGITRDILETLIVSKTKYLLDTNQITDARLTIVFTHWWIRESSSVCRRDESNDKSLTDFKQNLLWKTSSWFDEQGVSLLYYAAAANMDSAVSELLCEITSCRDAEIRHRRLSSRIPRNGIVKFGIPGEMTALMVAMCRANPSIVVEMLKAGADPFETDKGGYDALMAAAMYVLVHY